MPTPVSSGVVELTVASRLKSGIAGRERGKRKILTWLWDISDMDQRVEWVRRHSPDDLATMIARYMITRITLVLAYALWPVDYVLRFVGKALVKLVLGLLLLLILTGIWFPIWLTLVGTSWLWLRSATYRPLILVPGMFVAIIAHIYIMLVPDPHKDPKYVNLIREWPLSWYIWKPPEAYFEETGINP